MTISQFGQYRKVGDEAVSSRGIADVGTVGAGPKGFGAFRATGAVVVADIFTRPLPKLRHPVAGIS